MIQSRIRSTAILGLGTVEVAVRCAAEAGELEGGR